MTVFQTSLPSMHLAGDDLRQFEELILKDSTDIRYSFHFEKGDMEYTIESTDEFINNPDLPDIATSYSFSMSCKEGRVKLDSGMSGSSGKVRISGNTEWVRKKQRQLMKQISKNRKPLRTYSTKVIFSLYGISMFGFMVASAQSSGNLENVSVLEATLGLASFFLLIAWPYIAIYVLKEVHPYHIVKKDTTTRYRPNLQKLAKWAGIVLTTVAAVVTVVTNLG